ncbi:MAG: septum site-determining protein MinD [Clostridia bacterium]|nr:septum site-determining protein MinD [Clostridia bacterium]
MSKTIVVTSGKGGVGKSTVACFLGAKICEFGKRVIVCDLDFGLNNLDIVMGVEEKVVYDLGDAIEGRCRASQALIECPSVKNLYLLSSSHTENSNLSGQNIKLLFEGLKTHFDYVIFDCPAGIDVGFHRAVCACNEAIVVVTPFLSSLRDADKVLSILRSYKLKDIKLVVNMARGDLMAVGECISIKEVENLLKTPVIGVIPADDNILISSNCYLDNSTPSGKAFYKLARSYISGKTKYFDPSKKYVGIIGSIRRGLKKIV